ncbi:hypothetical protein A2U01_0062725, partial [Trifolium medium]|nr:hypothetical protein [Trifolium medium]
SEIDLGCVNRQESTKVNSSQPSFKGLRAVQTNPARSAATRRHTGKTTYDARRADYPCASRKSKKKQTEQVKHYCTPHRLTLRVAQVTGNKHTHSTKLRNAQHQAAQRAEAC